MLVLREPPRSIWKHSNKLSTDLFTLSLTACTRNRQFTACTRKLTLEGLAGRKKWCLKNSAACFVKGSLSPVVTLVHSDVTVSKDREQHCTWVSPEVGRAVVQTLHSHDNSGIFSECSLQRLLETEDLVALVSTVVETLFEENSNLECGSEGVREGVRE